MILALVLVLGLVSAKPKTPPKVAANPVAFIGGTKVSLEIRDNDSLRTLGLSHRRNLGWDSAMLFVFPEEQPRSFWMIDCFFDLDIAYIDKDGRIVDIQTMFVEPGVPPERLKNYPSSSNHVMYALEVNRGWFKAHGTKVGDQLPDLVRWKATR